ncbi:hypothetical protein [Paenibacillus monticola]|nr:hypothetical protein [Paenibacillus monticola]
MSYLKLIMSQGNKNAELEIEEPNDELKLTAIERVMRFFGVKPAEVSKFPEIETIGPIVGLNLEDLQKKRQTAPKQVESIEISMPQQPGRPQQLPLIGSERAMHTEIRELISKAPVQPVASQESTEDPEWYKTGIKYKDGMPHYRLRYWCKKPDCQGKGTEYILPNQMEVKCKACGTLHTIRPAAPKGEWDGWGNFFIADELAVNEG